MEFSKKDWLRSEGRIRIEGRDDLRTGKKLHAYHPAERENARESRPNEMLRMESSYGGISIGANRKQKMTMVFHEKRQHNGPSLKKDEQEVDGNRAVSLSELRGDFRTNSHDRVKSAMVYQEKTEETPPRMMSRIQEMMDENRQKSGEKMLPFMNRKEDLKTRERIEQGLRASLEQRNMQEYGRWDRTRESFRREQTEKAEMRRRFYQNLQFAREKSRRLLREEGPERSKALWFILAAALAVAGAAAGQEQEGQPSEASKTQDSASKAQASAPEAQDALPGTDNNKSSGAGKSTSQKSGKQKKENQYKENNLSK